LNISIVIISYNSARFLKDNLDSLIHQTVKFKHIVVVDNLSSDNSLEIINSYREAGDVEVLALQENTGYAAAANTGIRLILSDPDSTLVLVANSDIILEPDFNARVLEKSEADPSIGMLSPLILRFDRNTVDSAGQECSRTLHPQEVGFNRPRSDVEIREKPVFSVCGAATVFSRKALELLQCDGQYYDEDFFMFWEDFDIGWRARHLGIKTLFYPPAVVYHYRSGTLKRNFLSRFSLALGRSSLIKYHLIKNRYLTLIKNFRFKQNFTTIPFVFLKDIIWVSLLTISSPKIIIPLMKSFKYIRRGLKKRNQLKQKVKERSDEIVR
jgi:GT2 family glycosyltransferase